MAQVHGTAGNYPATEARKRTERMLKAVALALLVYAAATGYLLASSTLLAGLMSLLLAAALWWPGSRYMSRYLDRLEEEREHFRRGATGEQLVGGLLETLPDSWHVFHGVQLQARSDLDHVLVGPGGVFYVSTKSQRGLFTKGPADQLLCNGVVVTELKKALGQAKELNTRMGVLMRLPAPYVQAVLAVPFAWVDFKGPLAGALVLHKDNLVETVEKAPRRLTDDQVKACVKVVATLAASSVDLAQTATRARFPAAQPGAGAQRASGDRADADGRTVPS